MNEVILFKLLAVDLIEAIGNEARRIVDQHLYRAKRCRLGHHGSHAPWIGQVALNLHCTDSSLLTLCNRSLRIPGRSIPVDSNVHSLICQSDRDGPPDAPGSTGHESYSSGEFHDGPFRSSQPTASRVPFCAPAGGESTCTP